MYKYSTNFSAAHTVADDVADLLALDALGAYYGEFFVRNGGAEWSEAECEGRLQPALVPGAVTFHPRDTIRRRIFDGPPVDLVNIYCLESRAMGKK